MIRPLAIAAVGLSLLGVTAASAQVLVPAYPNSAYAPRYSTDDYVAPAPYAYRGYDRGYDRSYRPYGALAGQCSTDEGYGRRGSCETSGQ